MSQSLFAFGGPDRWLGARSACFFAPEACARATALGWARTADAQAFCGRRCLLVYAEFGAGGAEPNGSMGTTNSRRFVQARRNTA